MGIREGVVFINRLFWVGQSLNEIVVVRVSE